VLSLTYVLVDVNMLAYVLNMPMYVLVDVNMSAAAKTLHCKESVHPSSILSSQNTWFLCQPFIQLKANRICSLLFLTTGPT